MTLGDPVVLNTNTSLATGTTVSSGSISPPDDCLLWVAARTRTDSSSTGTMSSTGLTNVGTWTVLGPAYAGDLTGGSVLLAVAKVTGAAGTGTVTATFASATNRAIQVGYILGHDTASPIAQSKVGTASSSGTTYSFNLDAAPNASNLVLAAIATVDADVVAGTGFTELAETIPASNQTVESQFDRASASQTVAWSSLTNGNGRVGVAFEIAAAASTVVQPSVLIF